jgi:hypothetical protein
LFFILWNTIILIILYILSNQTFCVLCVLCGERFYLFATAGRYSEICGKTMTSAMATMSMITKGMLAL